jgi:hypothetical protein
MSMRAGNENSGCRPLLIRSNVVLIHSGGLAVEVGVCHSSRRSRRCRPIRVSTSTTRSRRSVIFPASSFAGSVRTVLPSGPLNRRGASPVMFRIARSISRGTAGVSSSPSSADPLVCRSWSTNALHHNKNIRPE